MPSHVQDSSGILLRGTPLAHACVTLLWGTPSRARLNYICKHSSATLFEAVSKGGTKEMGSLQGDSLERRGGKCHKSTCTMQACHSHSVVQNNSTKLVQHHPHMWQPDSSLPLP